MTNGPKILVSEATAPACWCSALVNGDLSGLEDDEIKIMNEWLEELTPWYVVDVVRNDEGEADEARFTNRYDLYGDTRFTGGDILDYVIHMILREGHDEKAE